MKRASDVVVESSNKRSLVESEDQIDQVSKLINYPFLLPLVIKFLQLRSILNLMLGCKDMRPFVNNLPVHKKLTQDEANKLIDPKRYVTFCPVFIYDATSPDLSMHPLLSTVHFINEFNTPIEPGHLPSKLSSIVLGDTFNQSMKPGTLPECCHDLELSGVSGLFSHVENLTFGYEFNHPFEPGCFSSKLRSLKLGKIQSSIAC